MNASGSRSNGRPAGNGPESSPYPSTISISGSAPPPSTPTAPHGGSTPADTWNPSSTAPRATSTAAQPSRQCLFVAAQVCDQQKHSSVVPYLPGGYASRSLSVIAGSSRTAQLPA